MATLREILLNQLAAGVTPSPTLVKRAAEEGKVTQAEIDRNTPEGADRIDISKPESYSSSSYFSSTGAPSKTVSEREREELLQEAKNYEDAAPTSCPVVNWEVRYFDRETRTEETIVIPARTTLGAQRIAETLTNGAFYVARRPTAETGGSWTSSKDIVDETGVVVGGPEGQSAADIASQVLPESVIGPVPPDIEKIILTGMDFATGYGANLWQQEADGSFTISSAGEDFRDRVLAIAQKENPNVTAEQVELVMGYREYQRFQQANPFMPIATGVNDWALNGDRWYANVQYYQLGYSQSDIDSYDYYKAYGSEDAGYRDISEPFYDTLDEYLANFETAQTQLQSWTNMAGGERTWDTYWDYYNAYAPVGTPKPTSKSDFFQNYDYFSQQLVAWQRQQQTGEGIAGLGGTSGTTTGREYWETPEYGNMATQWLNEQTQFSSALSRFAETQFPSLQRRFEGEIGRLEPYSSREGAIAEAERREGKFSQWLTEQTPDIQKKYWALRPSERGEKLYAFSPNVRTINW